MSIFSVPSPGLDTSMSVVVKDSADSPSGYRSALPLASESARRESARAAHSSARRRRAARNNLPLTLTTDPPTQQRRSVEADFVPSARLSRCRSPALFVPAAVCSGQRNSYRGPLRRLTDPPALRCRRAGRHRELGRWTRFDDLRRRRRLYSPASAQQTASARSHADRERRIACSTRAHFDAIGMSSSRKLIRHTEPRPRRLLAICLVVVFIVQL